MDSANKVEAVVREMLSRFVDVSDLDRETDIFDAGFVNSLLALQLVYGLEETWGFQLDEADLERSNFCSVANISGFVLRKLAGPCLPVN